MILYLCHSAFAGSLKTMDILQRKVILEDAVEYKFFLVQTNCFSSKEIKERLKSLEEKILAKVAPLLIQYIWQHQPFNLKYHPEKGITLSCHWLQSINIGLYGDPFFHEWQEMFQLTLGGALSLVTTSRMSGLLFTSYSKSRRLSQMWQLGEMKLVFFKQHINLNMSLFVFIYIKTFIFLFVREELRTMMGSFYWLRLLIIFQSG